MNHLDLETLLNHKLASEKIKDYAPNGLQVEGKASIKRVVTGVTACQALIDKAIELNADAILVHHGYFWKNELAAIRGMKGKRIRSLIKQDINLYGYHLPLDIHPEIGNNAELAKLLGIEILGGLDSNPHSIAMYGRLTHPISGDNLAVKINQMLQRQPMHIAPQERSKPIESIGWCTGSAQDYICLLYTSPSPRDGATSRMPSSA